MITRKQAMALGHKMEIHRGECTRISASRDKSETWRVVGDCKTFKDRPAHFELSLRRGFKTIHMTMTPENAHEFHLAIDCPMDIS